ncbi:MAG: hypothetical protein US31_C0002G0039 [Berkelbacteria bacterium GW2011_GWA1_36_9]|uniref:Ribbon-helix-helix protein CopG domain-containing protein n=1 Tax=Berkelbacteria bacterium GW2011_GWA1_36_9 TaxID=1618331 RepID=A0A0G0I366_9BACT|nr:MAG: hypothetical protein US31_C0002G0039 [Berkelbacteria bacterium GW2011_GWA1_36_9]
MRTKIINISIPGQLLSDADKLAEKEYRTRSELFREALRSYILTRQNLSQIYNYGETQAKKQKISPENLNRKIASFRKN